MTDEKKEILEVNSMEVPDFVKEADEWCRNYDMVSEFYDKVFSIRDEPLVRALNVKKWLKAWD